MTVAAIVTVGLPEGEVADHITSVHKKSAADRHRHTATDRHFTGLLRHTQFVPLTFFVLYASWQGQDSFARWLQAFEYSALLALLQLWLCRQQQPVNKLMLAANLYLLLGAAASVLQLSLLQWLLDLWRAQALFVGIALLNLLCLCGHPAGCLSVYPQNRRNGKKASLLLWLASLIAMLPAMLTQWPLLYSAFLPLLLLSLLEKWLSHRVNPPSQHWK